MLHTETRELSAPGLEADDADWLIGQTFDRFVVRRMVGRGGMGLVVEAHDPGLDRSVALKLVLDRSATSSAGQRLVREARAMAKLSHPNVVQVHEVGTVDGQVFLVMELVRGRTLSQWLATRPPQAKILEAFAAAASALHAAHRAGIVHRDFKPSNVLIDDDGRVRVTDFGIAIELGQRELDDEEIAPIELPIAIPATWKRRLADLTRTGAAIGTPRYMAPEQREGGEVTPQSDQYAFCVALWEAVFGRHPFAGDDVAMLTTVASTPSEGTPSAPMPPSESSGDPQRPRRHAVPKHVIAALRRGLARRATERWPAMDVLAQALSPRLPRWPWLVLPLVAIATIAVGFALSRSPEPTCRAIADDRIALVWNAGARAEVRAAFDATRLPAARVLAERATGALDRFAESWSTVFADGCTAARASDQAAAASERRQACLDRRLQALTGVLTAFAGGSGAELATRADAVVATLPAPAECANEQLGEDQQPAPGLAPAVAQLHRRLGEAEANIGAGRLELATSQLSALADDAHRLGWTPLRVRVELAAGGLAALRGQPALDLLTTAARDATANHMDLVAANAWAAALTAAGGQLARDQVELLAGMARAQAERTGDPAVVATVKISEGRARIRLGNQRAGEALCREAAASVAADGSERAQNLDADANVCLLEALSAQDRWAEVEPVARGLVERWRARNPVDHPLMADYLQGLGDALLALGRLPEARRAFEQCLEIRRKALGELHPRTFEAIDELANVAIAEGDRARAEAMLTDAVRRLEPSIGHSTERGRASPEHVLALLHRDLADLAGTRDDNAAARTHLEQAVELTRKSSGEGQRYAVMLLGLAQYYEPAQLDKSVAAITRAREILRAHGDTARAMLAGGLLGELLADHGRWAEALPLLEEAAAHLTSIGPFDRGVLLVQLARSIDGARGDRAKAIATAREAETALVAAGPDGATWLAKARVVLRGAPR